jgi:hypothetical protein
MSGAFFSLIDDRLMGIAILIVGTYVAVVGLAFLWQSRLAKELRTTSETEDDERTAE